MFERKLDSVLIEKLKNESLFINHLLPDIQKGVVFPAIRKNEIHFYYKGGRLFKYTNKGFLSNIKYVSVADANYEGDISEEKLKEIKLIETFNSGYSRIKENCGKYNKHSEAHKVSDLYKYSYSNTNNMNDIVLFDIEVSLESNEEECSQDRIDILLFNKKEKLLRFYEAKLFTNSQIRSKETPEVIEQLIRYDGQLSQNKQPILEQYRNYTDIVNNLLDLSLEKPEQIDDKVTLFVLDFDSNQEKSTTLKHLKESCKQKQLFSYFKGKTSSIEIENMWNALCN